MICKQLAEKYAKASNREAYFVLFAVAEKYKYSEYFTNSASTYFEYKIGEKCCCILISTKDDRQTDAVEFLISGSELLGKAECAGVNS